MLTSGDEFATDVFPLVDVALKAQQIIDECPHISKKRLGGLALVGNRRTFFVAVNGAWDPDASIRGGGGDAVVKGEVGVEEGVFAGIAGKLMV